MTPPFPSNNIQASILFFWQLSNELAVLHSCRYDSNDDGRLELRELRGLCDALGPGEVCPLNESEWAAALAMMDTNKNNYVEFDEFVAWWKEEMDKKGAANLGRSETPAQ